MLLLALQLGLLAPPSRAQESAPPRPAAAPFHLPAEQLDKALVDYGLAAQVQVLYDARLIAGQQSTAVEGLYTPERALEILLRGTGLHVHYVSAGAVTLAADPPPSREVLVTQALQIRAPAAPPDNRRFERFGQTLEQQILEALRQDARTRRRAFDVTLKVWVDAEGAVARTELIAGAQPGDQAAIAEALRGVRLGPPPPPDLPQPISFRFQSKPAY